MNRAEKRRQKKLAGKAAGASLGRPTPSLEHAIDVAVQHHTSGQLAQAEAAYRKILQVDPKQPVALHLLGVIAHQLGRKEDAVELISQAISVDPDYVDAHTNLGKVLSELGDLAGAATCFDNALAIKPDADTYNYLGITYMNMGREEQAIACYHKALAHRPDFAEAHNNLGNTLVQTGKLDEAIARFRMALTIVPDSIEVHCNLGAAFLEQGETDLAVSSFTNTLAIIPDHAEAYNGLGNAALEQERPDDAIANFKKALVIKPDYAEAHCNLAEALEITNRTDALRDALTNARRNCPNHPLLAIGEAQLLKHDGDFGSARSLLEATDTQIADNNFLLDRAYLLGDVCDRLGDTGAAYAYFQEGNNRRRDTPRAKRVDPKRYLARLQTLTKRYTPTWVASWRQLAPLEDRPDPVFLIGFPRSGTTLLDTILHSHPGICITEEKPALQKVRAALEHLTGGDPDGLATLEPEDLEGLRHTYFTELDKHVAPEDRSSIIIDKNPLHTVEAGLIHRIFPQARFLFTQRHPCDCVLSCFMQNFATNDAMINFLDLEAAAHLYDRVMSLWRQYQDVLPLTVHTVRYEYLVESFEETLTPALEFLGLDWDDNLQNYTKTAHQRGQINTASYNQVTQSLYTRARDRWQGYHDPMQPVLPTLRPWAQHFGYDV